MRTSAAQLRTSATHPFLRCVLTIVTAYLSPYKDDTPYYDKINMLGANYPPKPEEEGAQPKKRRRGPPSDGAVGESSPASWDGEE